MDRRSFLRAAAIGLPTLPAAALALTKEPEPEVDLLYTSGHVECPRCNFVLAVTRRGTKYATVYHPIHVHGVNCPNEGKEWVLEPQPLKRDNRS